MKIANISVKRPVAVIMVFLVILLLGFVSLMDLNMDLFPEMDLPMAIALTQYSGVGPEEVENLVTRPIEGAMGTVSGVQEIYSSTSRGQSMVYVEFAWGTDMNFAVSQMREKIDLASSYFPDDVSKTTLFKLDPNMMPVQVLGLSGDMDMATLDRLANDVVKPQLERIEGVAQVDVMGGVEKEIRISVAPQKLLAYGLSMDSIVSYLRMENRNTSVGTLEEGGREHTVRVTGEFKDVQEIENLQVPLSAGGYARLGDIARVEDAYKDRDVYAYMDGVPCVQISISKQTDANTVKVADAVKEKLAEFEEILPEKAEILVGFDQSDFIHMSLNNVTRNAFLGAFLAVVVLLLFLRNIRSTLIIAIAIPISVIATFTLMYFGGLTLNIVSLGGLALGVGMMVDNSIVILENIYRYRQEGYSRIDASTEGANEVGVAITASTLTSMAVFLPIVYVQGLASQVFRPLALTVAFSLLASLFVALTLVPMLSSKLLKVNRNGNGNGNGESKRRWRVFRKAAVKWGKALERLEETYVKILGWSIEHKKKLVFFVMLLFVVSIGMISMIGMEFMPKQDSGEYTVSIALPNGTSQQETERVTEQVIQYIHELPEHDWTIYTVGSSGAMMMGSSTSESASISGILKDKSQRTRGIEEILDELREECALIPGAEIEIASQQMMMTSTGSLISIDLKGDDLEVLKAFAQTVAERVKTVEGAREVKTSFEDGRPEIHLSLNRQKADIYGISGAQLASTLATAVNGSTATQYRLGGEEIDVTVRLEKEYRQDINDLKELVITSPTGAMVTLGDLAELTVTTGPTSIERVNQTRYVSITGDVVGRDVRSVTLDIQSKLENLNVPPGIIIEYGGANKEMMDAFIDLFKALLMAILLVYMILASQYESLLYPFAIMFSMPPMVTGVVLSLLLTGRTFNVPAFIGVIMLAGIVVNNAIVLVDYINTLRRRDEMPRKEAILLAGKTRLRPILMTALTTILAMLPLAIGLGEGAELSAPMATAVAGGLIFSTFLTLVLVPCMYIILENIGDKIKGFVGRKKKTHSLEDAPSVRGE